MNRTPPSDLEGAASRAVARAPRHRATLALSAVVLTAPLLVFACSNNPTQNQFTTSSTSSGSAGGSSTTTTGAGGSGGDVFVDAGMNVNLDILPKNPTLKVELPLVGQSVQFSCVDPSTNLPAPGASWTLSSLDMGSISAAGVFSPSGKNAGSVDVSCKVGDSVATTKLNVLIHALDGAGTVTPQQQGVLQGAPGPGDAQWQFLYPYDQTVFPKGILAPEIHLTAGSSPGSVFYLHIVAPLYEYEGYFNVAANGTQLQMSQSAWDALTNVAANQSVQVQVSKLFNGQKVGPIFRTWKIAAGKLHGTIYYNTYNSPLAQQNGAMMRIKGTSAVPEVLLGNCTVCHSIGSDGSTAAAANHNGPGGTFDLTSGNVNPPNVWVDPEMAAFAGLYPKNGEVLVINGAPGWGNTPGTGGMYYSSLRSKNGQVIPNSGIESYYAQSPAFSHDGTMLAFTDRISGQSSVLALMAYDSINKKFSNYQVLSSPQAGRHLSWPAFTPDNKLVVYQNGTGDDLVTWNGNTSKIFATDIATKQQIFLANLNGDGYMPQGARDENKNYEPTMAPIASGGYFWLMFTSRRTYGNKLTGSESETKRLWVSAIDINSPAGMDPSHPAFYIAGQELTSGNSRGFWALDPCKQDGNGCESGDECCNGFCNPSSDNPPVFTCGPPQGGCSDEFEPCNTAADCCNSSFVCIGGKCTSLPPH
jgi:hypothetical protein